MTFKNWINNKLQNDETVNDLIRLFDEKDSVKIEGLTGSAIPLLISGISEKINKSIFYVCKDEKEAENANKDLESLGTVKSLYFPSVENVPYSSAVVDEEVRSNRLEVLIKLFKNEKIIVTLSIDSLLFSVTPKETLEPYFITLNRQEKFDMEELSNLLVQSGYARVSKVSDFGEFSIKGEIVDVYYSIYKNPVRIDFFDDVIESIKTFDPLSQNSIEEIDSIILPPNKEYVYSEKEIKRAKKAIQSIEGANEEKDEIIEKLTNYLSFDGEQYYLFLLYEKANILDYLEESLVVFNDSRSIKKRESELFRDFNENYNLTAYKRKPRVTPENILFSLDEINEKPRKILDVSYLSNPESPTDAAFDFKGIPVYLGNIEVFKKDLTNFIKLGYKIVIFSQTDIQSERLSGIFKDFSTDTDKYDFNEKGLSILPLFLSDGFTSEKYKIFFLNDFELFGKRKISKHYYTRRTEVIDSFLDLNVGDYVVHINHGVGKFVGIERVKSFGVEKDYISILFADDDKIFIPTEQLNLIQKYISDGFAKPKLDRIGAKGWSKTKQKVKESIEKLAKELIVLYSYRVKEKGFAFLPDTPWQKEFEAKFPYDETEDQLLTLEEVKRDMESARPMDRLICGDVGFGKTEIAIRAGFKAVMSGKQVVILVPTTILAEQHFENFSERLKDYPIKVEMLSRFRTEAEQTQIIKKLKRGEVDIIIGTHRLLSSDIQFKNLGLYIIDEEHRFGVKHKEKIKQMRKNIDSLSLTATPIPRTLHMSLSKIRDISIINTPPVDRQSVETYVTGFSEEILINGVRKELERGGQVFFLYNRVKTIHDMKKYLEKLIPKIRVVIAHGQMQEDHLENVIHSFIHHEYDILLTTTIIESGIDMPRVNTIFIDRADRFGLSQLYQLKGRVGRSEKKAYAYLFYDPDSTMTEEAMKRLRVISEYTELGSGFKIAMKDMEIRGAGNLLGPEQHGDILAVGYQLYCKLLEESIAELAPEEHEELRRGISTEVTLELQYSGFIPDNYINDQKQKIEFYKKIAGITDIEEIDEIKRS